MESTLNKTDPMDGQAENQVQVTFKDLGLRDELVKSCEKLNWKTSGIQQEIIPLALEEKDIIMLTDSNTAGKIGAYVLPVLHKLLEDPQELFGLILCPTDDLALKVFEEIEALSSGMCISSEVLINGTDRAVQELSLAKEPHILVSTPNPLIDHLENTPHFDLNELKFLVIDEANLIFDLGFDAEIDRFLKRIPKGARFIFASSLTPEVQALESIALENPIQLAML